MKDLWRDYLAQKTQLLLCKGWRQKIGMKFTQKAVITIQNLSPWCFAYSNSRSLLFECHGNGGATSLEWRRLCKNSKRRKNNLYKASLTHHDNQKNETYKTYKNILRKCLKEAEVKYYEELFDNHKNSVYNMWKTLNPIINPKKRKIFHYN